MASESTLARPGRASATLADGAEAAFQRWNERQTAGLLAPATVALYRRHLEAFVSFAAAHGVEGFHELTASLCLAWIRSIGVRPGGTTSGRSATAATPSTMRLRRVVLAAATEVWNKDGASLIGVVPDIVVARPHRGLAAPLTPSEVTLLRRATVAGSRDLTTPAAVAAALAGAAQSEIARLTLSDVDLDDATLHLFGRGRSGARRIRIGPAGLVTFEARLAEVARAARRTGSPGSALDAPLALRRPLDSYSPHAVAPAVASTLSRAMKRAGITRAGVRPGSLRDYAANRTYAITGRVEDVADVVGLASLDRARALVDPDWQAQWADAARVDEG